MNNYSEMKTKVIITDIEKRVDKNQQDYWIIHTLLDEFTSKTYLAFSSDYSLTPQTRSILINNAEQILKKKVLLTLRKAKDKERVIEMEVEK